MSIQISRAEFTDINDLIAVQNKSFQNDYFAYGECPAYNESKSDMIEYITNRIVYKVCVNEVVIGDVIIKKVDEESFYLRVLCIIPEYHNKGIGQYVINYIESQHPKVKTWELITPFKSYRNHYFYEKMGYIKVDEYRHSDVLVMYRYRKVIDGTH